MTNFNIQGGGLKLREFQSSSDEIKPIVGYEMFYGATSDGRIFSFNYRMTGKTRELAQSTHPEGYKRVKAWHVNRTSPTPVHRLVALAFLPNPSMFPQVNHLDGNKGNNVVQNLEWCNNARNQQHRFEIGTNHAIGERHGMHKISESEARLIKEAIEDGPFYKGKCLDVAFKFGVSKHIVYGIKTKTWRHL